MNEPARAGRYSLPPPLPAGPLSLDSGLARPVAATPPVSPAVSLPPLASASGGEVREPARPPLADPHWIARVQVFLDRENFSPGPIDGRWGPVSRGALRDWQFREGLKPTGELDELIVSRIPSPEDAFTIHTVTGDEHAELRPFPPHWRDRAALDRHGYETILEAVAEQYHASERFIRELNPGVAWPNPAPGTSLRVPKVRPYARGRAERIEIRLSEKIMRVYGSQDRLIARFPCSIARLVEKRPVGTLQVVNIAIDPNYTFDPELFRGDVNAAGITRRLIIPPGPNNPVGVAWLGLNRPGYGIHGTPFPEDIGKTESHGCFRLANWNARKASEMVPIGTPVIVRE